MPNRLANENSPYLLQHVDNPVDWYPWGEEALVAAREADLPILLSIGYAACHWCHVMAHESFEDGETAVYMNQHFINIKVDREERPDIDSIYMNAVVALTGQGGWPMTVFMTPDGRPFYGGTYFPPTPRFGMPSFIQLMAGITDAWQTRRDEVEKSATSIAEQLGKQASVIRLNLPQSQQFDPNLPLAATQQFAQLFDKVQGGFSQAPKFPPSMSIEFLLQQYQTSGDEDALHMAEFTLQKMAYGGMYDQLGGGFARYSTDVNWLVPHFEKMLYDNALLARVYLHAFQITGKPLYRRIVEETLDFVIKEMRHEDGGFYSSYDADSEGEEGKFYVWRPDEIRAALGDDAELFMMYYDVSPRGNWEGNSILNVPVAPETVAQRANLSLDEMAARLEAAKEKLYAVRAKRVWPGLDDKVLTGWNGLMLAAFAEAGRFLKRDDYLRVASENALFLYEVMRGENGRLLRTWKAGNEAKYNGYLEDYAYLADGLLALYQASYDERWFVWARELADLMLNHFSDSDGGGFFDTSDDHEELLNRPKNVQDNAVPSPNGVAAQVLLRLSLLTGEGAYWDRAEQMIVAMERFIGTYPNSFANWLTAAFFLLGEPKEIALVGKAGETGDGGMGRLIDVVDAEYRPLYVLAVGQDGGAVPLLRERPLFQNQPTAYVCQKFVCQRPVTESEALKTLLTS